jgi:RHH-type proline utilization regulon transcriptional repressor/proline dehydrogenase/delta 1-pyrroline-5-carboxylate dehydrogenase
MGLPLLNDNRLNGLLMPNGSLLEQGMQRLLSERKGALIPIVTSNDINELLIRLVVEKTVSIDTTAAGGNASLMTM